MTWTTQIPYKCGRCTASSCRSKILQHFYSVTGSMPGLIIIKEHKHIPLTAWISCTLLMLLLNRACATLLNICFVLSFNPNAAPAAPFIPPKRGLQELCHAQLLAVTIRRGGWLSQKKGVFKMWIEHGPQSLLCLSLAPRDRPCSEFLFAPELEHSNLRGTCLISRGVDPTSHHKKIS